MLNRNIKKEEMIDFEKEYILENEAVKLSPLKKSDYEHLVHFSIEEPELWEFSSVQADSPEKLKLYIEKGLDDRKKGLSYPFIVFDKKTKKYAGSTRFYDIQLQNSMLQLGFTWYGKEFQGTGVNKNCKYLLLDFAFNSLKMERVEFRADNDNQRSIAAMKSIGCVVEGIMRSNMFKPNGDRRDSIVLSILKDEWESSVKEKLMNKLK